MDQLRALDRHAADRGLHRPYRLRHRHLHPRALRRQVFPRQEAYPSDTRAQDGARRVPRAERRSRALMRQATFATADRGCVGLVLLVDERFLTP